MTLTQTLEYNPTLESILMVEKAIEKYSGMYGKYQLWKKLPKKMMYQIFQVILEYLEKSNKIVIENDGKLTWIWDPEGIRKLKTNGLMIR